VCVIGQLSGVLYLYSPATGSKEKKTYMHINTMKKQQKQKTASKCRPYMPLCCYMR